MAQLRSPAVARTNNPATAQAGGNSASRVLTTTLARHGYPANSTTVPGSWPRLQPKLTISSPNDAYEQEADRIADQVMRMPDPAMARSSIDPTLIRPLSLRRKCAACEEEELQRKSNGPHTETPTSGLDTVAATLRQGGRPLDPATRAFFEPRFGVDFSTVRIHTDTQAAESARAVNALAYTVGSNVVFDSGQYAPHRDSGRRLLAHELTHVVQQGAGGAKRAARSTVGSSGDRQGHDVANDANFLAYPVSPPRIRIGPVPSLQRAVSKICNPPSMWFALGGPQNLPAAQAFGAIAETFISANVIATNGVALGNFYFDNPFAGPIDPVLVAFIIAKNPGMSLAHRLALAAAAVARPDVLMHQGLLTEFEEVKPNSVAGRAAGRTKVGFLSSFYPTLSLPYTAGSTYTPPPPVVIVSGTIPGTSTPFIVTFEVTRDRNGLLVYDICVETDWLLVAELAIALVILIILILLSRGAIRPVPMPAPPVPVLASGSPGLRSAESTATAAGTEVPRETGEGMPA